MLAPGWTGRRVRCSERPVASIRMTVHGDGTRSLLVVAVERASSTEAFWASTPRWQPGTARADIGSEPVVWSEAGLFGMDPVAAALVQHNRHRQHAVVGRVAAFAQGVVEPGRGPPGRTRGGEGALRRSK